MGLKTRGPEETPPGRNCGAPIRAVLCRWGGLRVWLVGFGPKTNSRGPVLKGTRDCLPPTCADRHGDNLGL